MTGGGASGRAGIDGDPVVDDDPVADRCEDPPEDGTGDPATAEAAIARIRDRGTTVRDRELETALSQLEARGDPSPADREAVADLADRLVEALLAVPESGLREGDEVDAETVETALELFG